MDAVIIVFLLLALLFGGLGAFVEGLKLLIIIAIICLLVAIVRGAFRP